MRAVVLSGVIALLMTGPAPAQLLPGLPGPPSLPSLPGVGDLPLRDAATGVVGAARDLPPRVLAQARLDRLRALVRAHPRELDLDDLGQPVVRGEVLAVSPGAAALERAREAGFVVVRASESGVPGVTLVTLAPPPAIDVRQAVRRLRALDPGGDYDFNHLYADAGGALAVRPPVGPGGDLAASPGPRVGLLDGGVDARHAIFRGVQIEQRSFAPGGVKPGPHGTAVAALLAGRDLGAAGPGASLAVADVYGTGPTGGSAEALVRALGWMAQTRTPVINISLIGPANGPLGAAVRALVAEGYLVVAAVGNDGPAAPPSYPASYSGVIAVTGVDRRGRLLPEAGRALHVDFAAAGAQVRAAAPGGGTAMMRGTSFAAPVVAGRLARLSPVPELAGARRALARLASDAKDLGAPGPDPVYGKGLVTPR